MTGRARITVEVIFKGLLRVRHHGARASRLWRHTPTFVRLLHPACDWSSASGEELALKTEELIRAGIKSLDGVEGEVLAVILGLAPGTCGRKLGERRRIAGGLLGVQADTVRRPYIEGELFHDLAMEIYRLHFSDASDRNRDLSL